MEVGNQLYDAYSRSQEVRALADIVGRAGLTGVDLKYLDVGDKFETYYLKQSVEENRNLEETLPEQVEISAQITENTELTKIKDKNIEQYFKEGSKQ